MHTIAMPPGSDNKGDCMAFNDTLEIVFKHSGDFSSSNDALFSPPLPPGHYPAGTDLKPFKPLAKNTTVNLIFVDTDDKKRRYVIQLSIMDRCS